MFTELHWQGIRKKKLLILGENFGNILEILPPEQVSINIIIGVG